MSDPASAPASPSEAAGLADEGIHIERPAEGIEIVRDLSERST